METTITLQKVDYGSGALSRIWITANRLGFSVIDNNEMGTIKYMLGNGNVSKLSTLIRRIKQCKADHDRNYR